ncbi:MAG: TIGR00341 family protein, partial [Bacteroidia bacterium]
MNLIYRIIKRFIRYRFSLHEDSAEENDIVESIRRNVEFRGANLWTLIFAVFIASIGLNVNSTAVIIGAMLVSPLMGPIMGIGLGVGTNDFELVKKGLRNLTIATVFSIATSTLYFYITPLHDASSELLARTSPSIWDVFIAGFGGLAGIVAATRREKSNVIPGVAIATALMPPLCTAGYGIASGNLYFFLGAIYLYFINSVFICV